MHVILGCKLQSAVADLFAVLVRCSVQVRWNNTGSQSASCSKDGDVRIWDGVSQKCVAVITNAHTGAEVSMSERTMSLSGAYPQECMNWAMPVGTVFQDVTAGCS